MRIDKFLSHMKITSRKDAKKFLKMTPLLVDGKRILDPSYDVNLDQESIFINDEKVVYKKDIHLMIYKPKNYLSANHDTRHQCVVELLKEPYVSYDFKIAGRLDLDSEGLMILTTDGHFQHEITHPKSHLPKTYEVRLDHPFNHEKELIKGVMIKDGKDNPYLAKALALKSDGFYVNIIIDEGKFHQVKRMFEHVGYTVLNLKRTKIGNLSLGNLKPGAYIEIEKEDLYD